MNPAASIRLMGIVLCGGRSKRMGSDKALLPHPSGGTYLSHAVERLKPVCAQVCLSGRSDRTIGTRSIPDEIANAGPAGGVSAALQFAVSRNFDAVLVTPVDMPSLSTDDLRLLEAEWRKDHEQLVVAQSETDHQLQPLVAIYPICFLVAIQTLAQGMDRSLNRWINGNSHLAVSLPDQSCHNINSPEDLEERGR